VIWKCLLHQHLNHTLISLKIWTKVTNLVAKILSMSKKRGWKREKQEKAVVLLT